MYGHFELKTDKMLASLFAPTFARDERVVDLSKFGLVSFGSFPFGHIAKYSSL